MNTRCLLLLLVFSAFFVQGASAQITLTAADLPDFGLVLESGQDTLIAELDVGVASDQPQSWDFTTLDVDVQTTNTVVMPSETPGGDLFPTATFAFESNDSLYSYAELRDDALLALGGSAPLEGMAISVVFDPPQQLLTVPCTYGSTFSSPFRFELTIDGSALGADSIKLVSNGVANGEIDAFGNITVPAGTYPALRQRTEITSLDSVFVKAFGNFIFVQAVEDTSLTYDWWGQNGLGTICTVELDTDGLPLSATFLTNVQPPSLAPAASFTFEEQQAGEFQFTDASTNEPTSWNWDFGDGTASTAQNPVHTYDVPGIYTVCLTAANSEGEDEACQELTVVFAPQAAFSFDMASDTSVQFTDLSSNMPASWAWDFGDGNTSTEQNPEHAYELSGSYMVCLTASNSAGSDESCNTVDVTVVNTEEWVLEPPQILVFPSPARDRVNVSLTGSSSGVTEIKVFNMLGQQMVQQQFSPMPPQCSFRVSDWQPGLYQVVVHTVDGQQLAQPFLVQ